jgi:hypothetical protein
MVEASSNISRITTTKLSNFTMEKYRNIEDTMIHFSIEGLKRYRGTKPGCYKQIYKILQDNALTITNYYPMMSEVNPADNYRRDNITLLVGFSVFHHDNERNGR